MREEPDAGVQPGPPLGSQHDDGGRGPGDTGGTRGQLWSDQWTDGGIPGGGQHQHRGMHQ